MSLAPEVAPAVHIPLRTRRLRVAPSSSAPPAPRPAPAVCPPPGRRAAVRPGPGVPGAFGVPARPVLLVRPQPDPGGRAMPVVAPRPRVVPAQFVPSAPRPAAAPFPAVPGEVSGWASDDAGTADLGARVLLELPPVCRPAPADRLETVGVRLTRRGRATLVLAAVVLALAVVIGAWISNPGTSPGHSAAVAGPEQIVVHDGDTLWSIASRVAPRRDPLAEVAELVRINRLGDGALRPGQILRLR
ncbi:MAG: LysM domain-containing protein [bacterium]